MPANEDRTAEPAQVGRAGGQNSVGVAHGGAMQPRTYVMADQPAGVTSWGSMAAALEIHGER